MNSCGLPVTIIRVIFILFVPLSVSVHYDSKMSQVQELSLWLQNISDKGMQLVADNYEGLKKLNITRYTSFLMCTECLLCSLVLLKFSGCEQEMKFKHVYTLYYIFIGASSWQTMDFKKCFRNVLLLKAWTFMPCQGNIGKSKWCLYANSSVYYLSSYFTSCSFSDKVYKKIGSLTNLTFLDLCGAQVTICFYLLSTINLFLNFFVIIYQSVVSRM